MSVNVFQRGLALDTESGDQPGAFAIERNQDESRTKRRSPLGEHFKDAYFSFATAKYQCSLWLKHADLEAFAAGTKVQADFHDAEVFLEIVENEVSTEIGIGVSQVQLVKSPGSRQVLFHRAIFGPDSGYLAPSVTNVLSLIA